MKIHHDEYVRSEFSDHAIGAVRLRGNDLADAARAGFEALIKEPFGETSVRSVVEHWAQVFNKMGAKPKYQSSLKNLLEGSSAGKLTPTERPLVDYYNQLSLHHGVPAGGYDVRGWDGDLSLVRSTRELQRLSFTPLGEPNAQPQHTRSGEIAYRDASKIVCRYWNWRDCHQSRLRDDSSDVVFVFDLVRIAESVLTSFEQLVTDVEQHFGSRLAAADTTTDGSCEIDLHD